MIEYVFQDPREDSKVTYSPSVKGKTRVRQVWDRAQMLIAFHRDPNRKKRTEPYLWPPKGACAGLRADVTDQETFIRVRGTENADDVQIKLRPNAIIARRRDSSRGWQGVEITDHSVRVLVGDVWVEIDPLGTVKRWTNYDATTTWLEFDGSIQRFTDDAEIYVSPDIDEVTRIKPERVDLLFPDHATSKPPRG